MDPGVGPSQGQPMNTRGRNVPLGPPSTPVRNSLHSLNGAPIPQLVPTTPSRKSRSPRKSKSKSPTRSSTPSPTRSPTSTSSRGVTTKEQLMQMQPIIMFSGIEAIKDPSVPKSVTRMWKDYVMQAKDERQNSLQDILVTPMKTKPQIDRSQYEASLFNSGEMENVMRIVTRVIERANKWRGKSQEPQWVTEVVAYLITELRDLSLATSADGRRIETVNMSHVSIAPHELCPFSPANTFSDANKRIDHAFAIPLSKAGMLALVNADAILKYVVKGTASINQTQATMTAWKGFFAHFEVKMDGRDPLIQLGVWIAAEFEKRFLEGYPMDVPIPAVAIYEDSWKLHIAYSIKLTGKDKVEGGRPYRVEFLGLVNIGNTDSMEGVFKILHMMKALVKWGFEVYEPQYLKKVLARHKK
ncbi:MAG: hypothetical protein Q9170_008271 [Blastenia crenularia]